MFSIRLSEVKENRRTYIWKQERKFWDIQIGKEKSGSQLIHGL